MTTVAFTKGTTLEFKLDTITEAFLADSRVKISFSKCKDPIFGKFVFDDDADFLFKDKMVRFVSNKNVDEFEVKNPMWRANLTKILLIDLIETVTIY